MKSITKTLIVGTLMAICSFQLQSIQLVKTLQNCFCCRHQQRPQVIKDYRNESTPSASLLSTIAPDAQEASSPIEAHTTSAGTASSKCNSDSDSDSDWEKLNEDDH